jgi:hypothetical protein
VPSVRRACRDGAQRRPIGSRRRHFTTKTRRSTQRATKKTEGREQKRKEVPSARREGFRKEAKKDRMQRAERNKESPEQDRARSQRALGSPVEAPALVSLWSFFVPFLFSAFGPLISGLCSLFSVFFVALGVDLGAFVVKCLSLLTGGGCGGR